MVWEMGLGWLGLVAKSTFICFFFVILFLNRVGSFCGDKAMLLVISPASDVQRVSTHTHTIAVCIFLSSVLGVIVCICSRGCHSCVYMLLGLL